MAHAMTMARRTKGSHRSRRILRMGGMWVTLWLAAAACTPGGIAGSENLPPNVQDPANIKTPAGALGFYRGVLKLVPPLFDRFFTDTGLLTDELAALPLPLTVSRSYTELDSRQSVTATNAVPSGDYYDAFHSLRAQAREARGFLRTYLADSSLALQGHLYAVEAYAEIWLADLYCSGIPLSTVDYGGDYTLAKGSTTTEVYAHAAALFDTAIALTGDSIRLQYLAVVGRGRALLGAGDYSAAAAAVAAVPDGYRYELVNGDIRILASASADFLSPSSAYTGQPSVPDREGFNGADFLSSHDPRVPILELQDLNQNHLYFPAKYPVSGPDTLVLADGIEARLIEAEAALQAGSSTWLTTLNALRTDGTFETQPNADDATKTDTLWHAGGGGVPGLRPLQDPGTSAGQVDLVFRERAFWLYLTGHREGDLRRLIRQYGRAPEAVYPTGFYPGGLGGYGDAIVALVPDTERQRNPKYAGCFHTNA